MKTLLKKVFITPIIVIGVITLCSFDCTYLMDNMCGNLNKKWQLAAILINNEEMDTGEDGYDCLKKSSLVMYRTGHYTMDTTCGLNKFDQLKPFVANDNFLIINNDTMEIVELNWYKLKLRKKAEVMANDSIVTITSTNPTADIDFIYYWADLNSR